MGSLIHEYHLVSKIDNFSRFTTHVSIPLSLVKDGLLDLDSKQQLANFESFLKNFHYIILTHLIKKLYNLLSLIDRKT